MKVGILTYHRTLNYGAFLQAYSLKKYIESLGNEVDIIDYWPKGHKDVYRDISIPNKGTFFSKSKALIKSLVLLFWKIKRRRSFEKLFVSDLGLTKNVLYPSEISLGDIKYDCIIYGSDQIWRFSEFPNYKGFDSVFFGEYIQKNIRKITYAASMGIISDFGKKDFLKSSFSNFSAISVRELPLKEFLLDGFNVDSVLVADPIFLNGKSFWESYATATIRLPKKPYILFYNLLRNNSLYKKIKDFSRNNNLEVIEITASIFPETILNRNSKQCVNPRQFLFLLKNAAYVFSTSFHGVAFSILFNKDFYALDTGKKFGRAKSLLQRLCLENRIINEDISFQNFLLEPVDYTVANRTLETFIDFSKEFIKKSL